MISHSRVLGFGAYVPERILSNIDLESMVETTDEWITQRTGMKERRLVAEGQYASDLAIRAVEDLISRHRVSVDEVDHIIVSTFTPDHFTPTISALVQRHFGMQNCGSFDLSAGCTGFVYAMSVGDALISAGVNKKILVIAAETVSKVVDYEDRATCILFGDGAAACLLEYAEEGSFLARSFQTDGDLAQYVTCGNFSQEVADHPLLKTRLFEQNGQQVYKYVMQNVPKGVLKLLGEAQMTLDELDWFVPHSANLRMIQTICDKLPFSQNKTLTSLEYFGNTSSASIPLAIWLAQKEGKLQQGQKFALYGFGGGLTHGGVLVRL